ncbi:hypothetical protein G6F57_006143 [Rhizopus arrhizus]|uniref:Aspartate--tRNA ligase, cytoplasmic n=1 Tax=Rhizopus oryzae TaxID=64495 RepID=A0A9P6XKE8_RHIOR|nr:hypothetical protein G6F24_007171 [Rhizopus arrhizus]KAG0785623.1 hypothetical protein G6F21_009135 [Rhizopus arrhizus]KAG0815669.1 hypothetical protein G6F20_003810 [Rhizopus arrhizus]KAG0832733.1 hypothetical protein G6F18_007095 [Rhizopus arrhizus]KAG0834148.1 hypothetical protein G6F19_005357 [Rhizopus arrhizus]
MSKSTKDVTVEEIAQNTKELIFDDGKTPISKKAYKKLQKDKEKAERKSATATKLAAEKAERESNVDFSADRYGKLPMNQSQNRSETKYDDISTINASRAGETITVRVRVQTSRATGSKMCFFVFRQGVATIQGIITADEEKISKKMVKFCIDITPESIVVIQAKIVKPLEEVKSCTVSCAELAIERIHIVSDVQVRLAFSLDDVSRPESSFEEDTQLVRVNLDTRLNNRVLDLRTTTNHAIFRLQSAVCLLFREFLVERGFMEIHTPKLIGAASEGGSNVFKVSYFKTSAFLAQSPQLYKQMCIAADFGKVFEIAPVFRAEDSNTHRHMTEFMGLDMEMAFNEHYHEVLEVLENLFVYIFTNLKNRFKEEIETVKKQYRFEDFEFLPKTLRLSFSEGIKMLREAGVELGDFEDLSTANEKFLGKLVKEKYHTDFYVLDKFPLAVRPFYTMPDPQNPGYSNSYDFFMRGEEILSGAQRVHDAEYLTERAKAHEIDLSTIQPYIDAFKIGAPPHAGGGIGLERVVMFYLGLGNIRRSSLFPRDPKRLEP